MKTSKSFCSYFILLLMLAANLFYVQSVRAYKIGHFEFNILSEEESTVDVSWEERPPYPNHEVTTDSIIIPSTVTINDKQYRVTRIQKNGFDEIKCDYIDIPSSVEVIEESAFSELDVDTVILKPGLKEIGESAFVSSKVRYCSVPNTVETIDKYAWAACRLLEAIDWPQNLTVIPDGCFAGCYLLKFDFKNITEIGAEAFAYSEMEHIHFPAGIHIGEFAFTNPRTKQLTFEPGPTIIENGAFLIPVEMEELELPEGLTFVGGSQFRYCYKLKKLVIHDNVTFDYGAYAFNFIVFDSDKPQSDHTIDQIVYLAKYPQSFSSDMFSPATYSKGKLYVLPEAYETAKKTEPWYHFKNIYPIYDGVQQALDCQEDFEPESEALFDLQGRKVTSDLDNLKPGVYISIKGNKRSKIIVR